MSEKLYTGSAVKRIDQIAIGEHGYVGLDLMTLAGEAAFKHICDYFPEAKSMLVLCGGGNNGGDGYVVARSALQRGWQVQVVSVSEPKTDDAKTVYQDYLQAKGKLISAEEFVNASQEYDVLVDALLGVGLQGAPQGDYAKVIERADKMSTFMVAIDVPSGVDADTGKLYQPHISADLTVTYIANKLGLLTGAATNTTGRVILEDLNIESEIKSQVDSCASLISHPELAKRLNDTHKGSYGHVVIAGGDNGMLGAILLAGQAALRSGAGKVHLLSTAEHLDKPALACAELMSGIYNAEDKQPNQLLEAANVIAVGPGLGLGQWSKDLFDAVIKEDKPIVVDADALTLLAGQPIKKDNWVLTPHPGEAATLLGISTKEVQSNRLAAAKAIAANYGGVCVLKGAGTLIAEEHGEVSLCDLGNPGMATAGMGDVLTGIIAAFIGQGLAIREATEAAVWLHASTADKLVSKSSQRALLASDIIQRLATALFEIEDN